MPAPSGSSVPPLNVRIVVSTSGAAAAATTMRSVTSAAGGMGGAIGKSAMNIRTLGDAMRQTGSLIKYAVIGGLVNMGTTAIQTSRTFEVSMKRIQGLVGIAGNEVQRYKDNILSLGAASGKGPVELAEALYFITSAGIKGSLALDVLNQSARSAAAGLGETKVVADALTSILNSYGTAAYSATKANDILVATVREGKAEADQFAPALGKVLPIAAAFGASFEDVSAGVAALTRGGASAGTSAIYLRQVLSQLLKPSKAAAEQMQAVGTSAAEMRDKIQKEGLLTALEYLNTKLGGNQYNVASEGLTKVFGNVRALTAVFSLLGPNLEQNREIFYQINDAAGSSAAAFEAYSQTADYAFKKAAAEGQAAMVRLGDSIMPIATSLMGLGGAFARVAETLLRFSTGTGIVGKFGKAIVMAGAAGVFLSKGLLFLFLRLSSYIRLMGNGITVLRGFAGSLKNANGTVLTLADRVRLLGFTTQQQTNVMNQATISTGLKTLATGEQAIAETELYGIMAANSTTQKAQALYTTLSADASNTATVALNKQAIAEFMAANATRTLGATIATAFPLFIGLATLAYTLATAFGLVGGGLGDGLEGDKKSLSDLNELLGTTARYSKSNMVIKVILDATGAEISAGEKNTKFKEAISKALGEEYKTAIEDAAKYGGENAQTNLSAAIIGQLELSPEDTKIYQQAFADLFNIDPTAIAAAASTAGNIYNRDFVIAASMRKKRKGIRDILPDFNALEKETSNGIDGIVAEVEGGKLENLFKKYGKNLSSSINELDFGTFIESISATATETEGMASQAYYLQAALESAFSPDNIDSAALGNDFQGLGFGIQGIFAAAGNMDNLKKLFEPMGLGARETEQLVGNINEQLTALGPAATEAEKIQVVSTALDKIAVSSKTTQQALIDARAATYDVATEFKDGLNPEIQAIVDAYNEATDAIKKYEEGQKALAGSSQDLIEAQIDANEAASAFGESFSAAGNKVGTSGLAGAAMKDLIKFKDEILNVSNIITSTDGPAAGAQFFAQEWQIAMDTLQKGGATAAEAEAQLSAIGFSLTDVPKTWTGNKDSILSGLSDAYKTDTALPGIGNDIVSGIGKGLVLGQADKTAISSFNAQMLKQFKDDWGIKSPSKVAEQIGNEIKYGLINGLTNMGQSQLNALEWLGKRIAGTITAAMYAELPSMADLGAAYGIKNVMGEKEGGVNLALRAISERSRTAELTKPGTKAAIVIPPIDPNAPGNKNKGGSSGTKDDTVYLTGAMGQTQKDLKKWLEGISKIAQFTTQYIEKVSGDAGKALGYISSYIDAQLNKSESMLSRQKLMLTQELLIADLQKAQREQMYQTMKAGANLGRDVTGYEMSRIQDLQTAYETAVRAYSMKRGSYADMIDAQIALQEAQSSASEASQGAVSAETGLLDAKEKLATKDLELAKATLEVVKAQQEQVDAAINLQIHMNDARKAFAQFAYEAIPNVITSIDQLGLGLNDPKGVFMTSLHGLGNNIFNLLATAAEEAGLISGVPKMGTPPADFFPGPDTAAGAGPSAGATGPAVGAGDKTSPNFGKMANGSFYGSFMEAVRAIHPNFSGLLANGGTTPVADSKASFPALYNLYKSKGLALAKGGLVMGATQALIGESGPELVLPLNNMNITTALERLTDVKKRTLDREYEGNNRSQVFNIVVNNPVPETATESISRRMKTLSNAGLFG